MVNVETYESTRDINTIIQTSPCPMQKPYTSYTCIKHVKAEGRFKGDFLIEQTSLIPLGLNKHRLNTCNYAIYSSRISRDRVLLISDRYYPWSSETKTFYIDLLNKWRHCSLTKTVTCHSAKEYIRLNYLEKKISKSWGRFCWVS